MLAMRATLCQCSHACPHSIHSLCPRHLYDSIGHACTLQGVVITQEESSQLLGAQPLRQQAVGTWLHGVPCPPASLGSLARSLTAYA